MDIIVKMLSIKSPSEVAMELAGRVRERRLERGWSQDELAQRSGLKLSTYILFERTGRIALVRLLRVLDVLGHLSEIEKVAASEPASQTLDQLVAPKRKRGRRRHLS